MIPDIKTVLPEAWERKYFMTCSIIYDAIKIKTTRFENPAPIINTNELAAAVLIACRQAGITPPEISTGMSVEELRTVFFQLIEGREGVNPRLLTIIREYPHEKQTIDEATKTTYEFGLSLPDLK